MFVLIEQLVLHTHTGGEGTGLVKRGQEIGQGGKRQGREGRR